MENSTMNYTKGESIIVTDDGIYDFELMPDLENASEDDFKEDIAYLDGDYFYFYRGKYNDNVVNHKPGIYHFVSNNQFILVPPTTEEEKEYYSIEKAMAIKNTVSIIDTANTKEDLLVAIPESAKIFRPEITEHDDILKLAAKKSLLIKKVDLDHYKDRFPNKNTLFNLKQVFRSDNTLSMKIFNRFIDALNLKYTVTIEELSDKDVIGEKLSEPIVVSSEESYEV